MAKQTLPFMYRQSIEGMQQILNEYKIDPCKLVLKRGSSTSGSLSKHTAISLAMYLRRILTSSVNLAGFESSLLS